MIIKEIDADTFNEFANNHILKNYFQTKEYGTLMSKSDYSVMYIGAYQDDVLLAGSLILHKPIGPNMRYGYAPRGFLIDYYDTELLTEFTKKIKEFFIKKRFVFIKINPEITYAKIDFDKKTKMVNAKNKMLVEKLKELGYDKLKDNLYFESLLPKYTPVIHLKNYDFNNLDNDLKENVLNSTNKGLNLKIGNEEDLKTIFSFIENKNNNTYSYYEELYKIFKPSDMIDLLLFEINYDTYAKYLQRQYNSELEKNELINYEFNKNPNNNDLYNQKMKSDQTVSEISSQIVLANNKMNDNQIKEVVGGAIIIKHQGRVTILITGQTDQKIFNEDIKTSMFYKIIEEYKKLGYLYIDLYGITGDFSDTNPYKELNDFKLKFKPDVYEYIGEFDLIVNKAFHQILWSTNTIQKEFYKPAIKRS